MGEPARGQTPFKALTRHSQLLAEHPTRQTREAAGLESHEARAAPGTRDAPDTADRWALRPGRADVDTPFRRTWVLAPLPPEEGAGSPAGARCPLTGRQVASTFPRVSLPCWEGVCQARGRRALAPKGGSCAAGGAGTGDAGTGGAGTEGRTTEGRTTPAPRGCAGAAQPDAGLWVRAHARAASSRQTRRPRTTRQSSSFRRFHPGRPQVQRSRLPLPRPPRPEHLAQCTWPSPGPTYTHLLVLA